MILNLKYVNKLKSTNHFNCFLRLNLYFLKHNAQ